MKKITNREKILMILAAIVIAVVLFDNLFVSPILTETKDIKAEIETKTELLQALENRQTGYDSIANDLERSKEEYEKTVGQFPKDWDEALMLEFIEETIGDKLEKKSLIYNGVADKDNYCIGTYTLSVSGPYKEFLNMLEAFENAKYFNTVTSVRVPTYSYDDEEDVEASFTISFYALRS